MYESFSKRPAQVDRFRRSVAAMLSGIASLRPWYGDDGSEKAELNSAQTRKRIDLRRIEGDATVF